MTVWIIPVARQVLASLQIGGLTEFSTRLVECLFLAWSEPNVSRETFSINPMVLTLSGAFVKTRHPRV
jgi:hypothetical protein